MENEQVKEESNEKKVTKRRLLIVGLVLVAIFVAFFVHNALKYQSTDDAYVETTTVQVAPRVSGQIIEVHIDDNQRVKKGDLVAVIDPVDYEIKLEQAQAKYEKALLEQKYALSARDAANSEIAAAKADLERYKNLYKGGAVSKQMLDNAQTKYDNAVARQTSAEQAVMSKTGGLKVADANIKELKAQRDQAKLNLSYTKIYAPQDGTVSSRRVEEGMYVNVGSPLFTIVPDDIWVVANFKENQLRHMKVGQVVEIKVDTYPDKKFKGKIDSIQRSSGAKSSMFPPENAVGSFVKIVQRIPVKIVFDEEIDKDVYNIVPGMSVVPKVKVK
ncbi:TPA: HlyD family secretion protein [Candidatus Galligastranaerophilus intestinavium]|uniref:HlyD family secretion protein n=1 Tax=Candidatus Galligastranaerophilus intestinavium TaxID=2840836 RepID=A0A9D1JYV8_9BACT|nr:HlyD family secretion protein [Candidatus Galligastranaerophilus intestinavium]